MIDQPATAPAAASASSTVVAALGPAFAAGFAVQQLLEVLDPVVSLRIAPGAKKAVMGLASIVIGLVIAFQCDLRVLHALQSTIDSATGDHIVSGIIISAGTEGFNSVMKFLGYAKDAKKADAADKVGSTTAAAVRAIDPHAAVS